LLELDVLLFVEGVDHHQVLIVVVTHAKAAVGTPKSPTEG